MTEAMATTQKLTYVNFAPITKFERSEDGNSLYVYGKATDETLDGDGQIVDLAWAGKALQEWLVTGGNIRQQHNPMLQPAGVGVELDIKSDGAYVTGEIVEPVAMRLVEKGALRAYSVGIANPKVVRDAGAPHGRIIDGQIVEVSVVDRPANPSCGIKLMKSADGQFAYDTFGGEMLEKDDSSDDGNDASEDVPQGDGDTDSDSDSDDDSTDNSDSKKKSKKVKKSGDQLGKSTRRRERQRASKGTPEGSSQPHDALARGEGSDTDEGSLASKTSERTVAPRGDSDHASPDVEIEKVDLTDKVSPVINEVGKRDRGADGKWSNHSNPVNHDPAHHDSTDPSQVVGAAKYDGQAENSTPMDTDLEGEAERHAEARAATQQASLPVTTDSATSQETPPSPVASSSTKQAKKAKKLQKRLRKQAKIIKALKRKQREDKKVSDTVTEDVDTLERWNALVVKGQKDASKIAELEERLEKFASQPTLGKAIRAPQSVRSPEIVKDAEAQQRAADTEFSEREAFLESVARFGTAEQQDAAQNMLLKMRATNLLNK